MRVIRLQSSIRFNHCSNCHWNKKSIGNRFLEWFFLFITKRFISFSDLQLDDTKNVSKGLNKMPEDIEDDHDEEVVLMVHPSEPKDNVVPYND